MSNNEHHRMSKRFRTLCAACQKRKARFEYRGEVRADRDHTLCFECYRAQINCVRARRLSEAGFPLRLQSTATIDRQFAHRQRMLTHLESRSSFAS
jgi:hypothetical protein